MSINEMSDRLVNDYRENLLEDELDIENRLLQEDEITPMSRRARLRAMDEPIDTRRSMRAMDEPLNTRRSMRALDEPLDTRRSMRALDKPLDTRRSMRAMNEPIDTRRSMRALDEPLDTRRSMRALDEPIDTRRTMRNDLLDEPIDTRRSRPLNRNDMRQSMRNPLNTRMAMRDEPIEMSQPLDTRRSIMDEPLNTRRSIKPTSRLATGPVKSPLDEPLVVDEPINLNKPVRSDWLLNFTLPGQKQVQHRFDKNEPFNCIVKKIKENVGQTGVIFIINGKVMQCHENTPISNTGITNQCTIIVAIL